MKWLRRTLDLLFTNASDMRRGSGRSEEAARLREIELEIESRQGLAGL